MDTDDRMNQEVWEVDDEEWDALMRELETPRHPSEKQRREVREFLRELEGTA